MFGALSAPQEFAWGDMYMGEQITCTGRQYLRLMIKFFKERGYIPLVLDTDGVNFSCPEDADNRTYIGKGLHRFVKKDVVYTGIDADVAEYNERYMFGAMGLDIDDIMDATINLSRKNYAILKPGGKVKLTGNTIKGKTIPKYIEKFLAKAIRLLLDGKGKESTGPGNSYYLEDTQHFVNADSEKRITNTLDNIYDDSYVFDLVKLDTQGSELDIIKGGKELFKRVKGVAGPIYDGIKGLKSKIGQLQVPNDQVKVELERLKAESPEYKDLVNRLDLLIQRKAELAQKIEIDRYNKKIELIKKEETEKLSNSVNFLEHYELFI
jgi:hypothetical protein